MDSTPGAESVPAIAVLEPRRLYRDGLVSALEREPRVDVTVVAESIDDVVEGMGRRWVDVIVLDTDVVDLVALEQLLATEAPAVRVVATAARAVPGSARVRVIERQDGLAGLVDALRRDPPSLPPRPLDGLGGRAT